MLHLCGKCRYALLGRDFVGHSAREMDEGLSWHLSGACCSASLSDEVLSWLERAQGAPGAAGEALPEGDPPVLYLARRGLEDGALRALALSCSPAADVRARDRFGVCALHHAAHHGMLALVAALLAAHASVHARTGDSLHAHVGGRTPLHLAVASAAARSAEVVSALLRAGADALAEDADGVSARELARGHSDPVRAALARAPGADADVDDAASCDGVPAAASRALERACARDRQQMRLCIAARPLLSEVHVLRAVWSAAECAHVRECALRVARARGWQSARHAHHPTLDLPLWRVPAALPLVREALRARVLPEMGRRFGIASGRLRVREAFFVQYCADGAGARAGLELHRDGTLLSCNVALNGEANPGLQRAPVGAAHGVDGFDGGGTYFAHDDRTVRGAPGDFVLHCGQLLHGAAPVLAGRRLVLVCFIDELDEHEGDEEEPCGCEAGGTIPGAPSTADSQDAAGGSNDSDDLRQ